MRSLIRLLEEMGWFLVIVCVALAVTFGSIAYVLNLVKAVLA